MVQLRQAIRVLVLNARTKRLVLRLSARPTPSPRSVQLKRRTKTKVTQTLDKVTVDGDRLNTCT